jgi:DNA-directed RNA polymerase I, II, and III subunit RPABC4
MKMEDQQISKEFNQESGQKYECGSCKEKVLIEKQDPIRCKKCGYRILYKLRSKRPSEYFAR